MKVALLGAPGSGKTKIAGRIARRLNTEAKSWVVVDGYVDNLRKRTDRQFGPVSDLEDNLMVLSERRIKEDEAVLKQLHTITCGTIYETVIYSAAQSMLIPGLADEGWMLEETQIAQITMQALGILERRTFDYDALFYLPLHKDPEAEFTWDDVVDAKLGEVLEGFNRLAIVLDGTDRQKVDRATEVIRTIITAIADDDQQTVSDNNSAR